MIFEDVVSGDAWQPESAARYNAVNALLREHAPLTPMPQQQKSGWAVGKVLFYNASNSAIPAWSAVALAPGTGTYDRVHCLSGSPATNDAALWGIAQSNVPAGCCGEAVVSGVTEAEIVSGGSPDNAFVSPQSTGLMRTANGRAEILSTSVGGNRVLLLLGGGGSGSEYNGYFKIVRTENGIAVVDGSDQTASICGHTDLPGCADVSRCEIAGASGTVTLYVHYDSTTGVYSTSFTNGVNAVLSQLIGRWSANGITQLWRSETISFSRFYFL